MAVNSTYVVCTDDEGKQCSDSTLDLNPRVSESYSTVNILLDYENSF